MWTRKHIFRKIISDFETKRGIRRATHVDKSWRVKTKLRNFPPNSLQNLKAFHIFRPDSGSHERLSLKGFQRRRKCVLWFDLNRHCRVWYNCYMFVMVSLTILTSLTRNRKFHCIGCSSHTANPALVMNPKNFFVLECPWYHKVLYSFQVFLYFYISDNGIVLQCSLVLTVRRGMRIGPCGQ